MAYSQQAPYGRPQRPHHGKQEPSYASVYPQDRPQYAHEQGYNHNGDDRGEYDQHYQDLHGGAEDPKYGAGYDPQGWSESSTQRQKNDGYYAVQGRHPHGNVRPGQHQHPKTAHPTGYGPGDSWSHGVPPSKSRSPTNGHHEHPNPHHQNRGHLHPRDRKLEYDRYQPGVPLEAKAGHGYDDVVDGRQDNWHAPLDYDHGYDNQISAPNSNPRHRDYQQPPMSYDRSHGQKRPQDVRHNTPHSDYNHEMSKPNHPKIITAADDFKQEKRAPKRILEDLKSPETVAWDNPFPTFPAAKIKPKVHNSEKEHNKISSTASGPNLANEKNGHEPSYHDGAQDESVDQGNRPGGNARVPVGSRNGHQLDHQTHKRPSNSFDSHPAPQAGDPNIPGILGRHSEDNRLRPTVEKERPPNSAYGNSRTMPLAFTNAIANPHDEMPEVAVWQEPGATAGYYGGEDKGFVHSPPIGALQSKRTVPPRAQSDEDRSHQKYSRLPQQGAQQLAPTSLPHAPQDGLRRAIDPYHDATRNDSQPYVKENPYQQRQDSADEMPKFFTSQSPNATQEHEIVIGQQLQPQLTRTAQPPPVVPLQDQFSKHCQYNVSTPWVDPFPRSRSQPDSGGQHFPPYRPEQGQSYGVGISRPTERRPATSSSNVQPGGFDHHPVALPPDDLYQDPWTRGRENPERIPGAGRLPERLRGNGYQDMSRPDRLQSPPLQNDLYRDRAQQERYRSPLVQNAQSANGRTRRTSPGGGSSRPSPSHRNGPSSPPNHSFPNPDALPHHPAPIRPGLMGASSINTANKPPPVRQYYQNAPPIDSAGPAGIPGPGPTKGGKQGSASVTYQELDKLRQKTQSNPEDSATRFLLAMKLIEASTVLVNERTDSKSREKARDDYIAQALKMLKKLSSNQYPEAMFYLGDCHSRGALGLQADVKEAFTLYQSAAKANHAQAAYRVAVCCEMGQDEGGGTRKDPIKAMQWYKRAGQLGDVPAMYKMGIILLKGLLGQPRNPREALVFLKKAAERADAENPHALHELGLLHEKGSEGVPKDERYSKDLFMRCANLGYKFSQYRLGCAFEYGLLGCPVDPRQSISWYSKAAIQEEHQSELALSGWYLTGSDGVLQQSDTEAYLWARKAAQAGLAKAEYAMGYFTEVGIGAPANLEDAKRWYWRAACKSLLVPT